MVESFTNSDVVVIGAGAAGLMAAGRAAECGASVVVLEKTDGPGKKILVSGKSRCNLTNSADRNAFLAMYGPNGRFLHGAFSRFFRPELLAFFEWQGLKTKLERGGRIFPVSDDARDVVGAFERYLSRGGVRTVFNAKVEAIRAGDAGFVVQTARGDFSGRTVVIATGGLLAENRLHGRRLCVCAFAGSSPGPAAARSGAARCERSRFSQIHARGFSAQCSRHGLVRIG